MTTIEIMHNGYRRTKLHDFWVVSAGGVDEVLKIAQSLGAEYVQIERMGCELVVKYYEQEWSADELERIKQLSKDELLAESIKNTLQIQVYPNQHICKTYAIYRKVGEKRK